MKSIKSIKSNKALCPKNFTNFDFSSVHFCKTLLNFRGKLFIIRLHFFAYVFIINRTPYVCIRNALHISSYQMPTRPTFDHEDLRSDTLFFMQHPRTIPFPLVCTLLDMKSHLLFNSQSIMFEYSALTSASSQGPPDAIAKLKLRAWSQTSFYNKMLSNRWTKKWQYKFISKISNLFNLRDNLNL